MSNTPGKRIRTMRTAATVEELEATLNHLEGEGFEIVSVSHIERSQAGLGDQWLVVVRDPTVRR